MGACAPAKFGNTMSISGNDQCILQLVDHCGASYSFGLCLSHAQFLNLSTITDRVSSFTTVAMILDSNNCAIIKMNN